MNPSSRRLYRLLLACLLVALVLTPLAGMALASPVAPVSSDAVKLPAGVEVVGGELPIVTKDAGARLDSRLAQMVEARRAGEREKLAAFAGERYFDLATNTVRVIIEMARDPEAQVVNGPTYEKVALPDGRVATIEHAPQITVRSELVNAIVATGATYETAYRNLVQVSAPLDSLEALSRMPDVVRVRFPLPAQQHEVSASAAAAPDAPQAGASITEGAALTNADEWAAAGYNGSGVNLAVFDFGFTGYASLQASGDLPSGANLVLKDYSADYTFGDTGYEHGAACAEIAYDMAPSAKVYLYAWGTDAEFGNAVADYETNVSGKKVATMSIGWVNAGPYDGTGPIDDIVNTAANTYGIFWANSAGNARKEHYSWTSTQYSTGNSVAFGTGNIEGIGPTSGSVWNIPAGNTITVFLEWNDWNTARTANNSHVDYDLYLLKWTGSTWSQVASSVGNQCSGTTPPTEEISFTTTATTNPYYGVVVQRYTTGCTNNFGHWMELFTFNGFYTAGTGSVNSFWYVNECNSLTIPADATGAVATGATFWGDDSNSSNDYGLETFSSFGPRNASGGTNPGTTVNKPDVVAPEGVSTETYGASNSVNYANGGDGFWGTSGAAPHVAGAAADVWTLYPSYTLAQVRNYLQGEAIYKAGGSTCGGTLAAVSSVSPQSGTQNNRYGWGRLNLLVSPTAVAMALFRAQSFPLAVPLAGMAVVAVGAVVLIRRRRR